MDVHAKRPGSVTFLLVGPGFLSARLGLILFPRKAEGPPLVNLPTDKELKWFYVKE